MDPRSQRPPARSRRRASAPLLARWSAWWREDPDWALPEGLVWLVVLVAPLAFSSALQDSFRLPKRLAADTLALASLVGFVWRLRDVETVDWRAFLRRPAVVGTLPLLLVASASYWTSDHPSHVGEALIPLWIGAGALAVWSAAIRLATLRRLVAGLLVPAAVLALVAVLQQLGWVGLTFVESVEGRLAVTSLAGNPFDLAAFLVLPALVVQGALWRRETGRAWQWALLLALLLAVLAATQTLSALLAAGLGSLVLWGRLLPRRRFLALIAGAALVGSVAATAVGPLRDRVERKLESLVGGDWNDVSTGRLDAWRAAVWMLETHPLTGVGHGAFRTEYAAAKLALAERGARFYRRQDRAFFDSAHNEALEVAATLGWPGVAALVWALAVLARVTVRAGRHLGTTPQGQRDAAVAFGGLAALAVLATTNFPLHLAAVAFGFLLLTAAVVRAAEHPEECAVTGADSP